MAINTSSENQTTQLNNVIRSVDENKEVLNNIYRVEKKNLEDVVAKLQSISSSLSRLVQSSNPQVSSISSYASGTSRNDGSDAAVKDLIDRLSNSESAYVKMGEAAQKEIDDLSKMMEAKLSEVADMMKNGKWNSKNMGTMEKIASAIDIYTRDRKSIEYLVSEVKSGNLKMQNFFKKVGINGSHGLYTSAGIMLGPVFKSIRSEVQRQTASNTVGDDGSSNPHIESKTVDEKEVEEDEAKSTEDANSAILEILSILRNIEKKKAPEKKKKKKEEKKNASEYREEEIERQKQKALDDLKGIGSSLLSNGKSVLGSLTQILTLGGIAISMKRGIDGLKNGKELSEDYEKNVKNGSMSDVDWVNAAENEEDYHTRLTIAGTNGANVPALIAGLMENTAGAGVNYLNKTVGIPKELADNSGFRAVETTAVGTAGVAAMAAGLGGAAAAGTAAAVAAPLIAAYAGSKAIVDSMLKNQVDSDRAEKEITDYQIGLFNSFNEVRTEMTNASDADREAMKSKYFRLHYIHRLSQVCSNAVTTARTKFSGTSMVGKALGGAEGVPGLVASVSTNLKNMAVKLIDLQKKFATDIEKIDDEPSMRKLYEAAIKDVMSISRDTYASMNSLFSGRDMGRWLDTGVEDEILGWAGMRYNLGNGVDGKKFYDRMRGSLYSHYGDSVFKKRTVVKDSVTGMDASMGGLGGVGMPMGSPVSIPTVSEEIDDSVDIRSLIKMDEKTGDYYMDGEGGRKVFLTHGERGGDYTRSTLRKWLSPEVSVGIPSLPERNLEAQQVNNTTVNNTNVVRDSPKTMDSIDVPSGGR